MPRLSPVNLALQGLGFGPQAVALHGFVPVGEVVPEPEQPPNNTGIEYSALRVRRGAKRVLLGVPDWMPKPFALRPAAIKTKARPRIAREREMPIFAGL